jgi:VanZ family protein
MYLATTRIEIDYPVSYFDKINHLGAFCVLSFFVDFAFPKAPFGIQKTGFLIFYGTLIEIVQYFIPYRDFSLADILADATGILLYIIMIPIMNRLIIIKRAGTVRGY